MESNRKFNIAVTLLVLGCIFLILSSIAVIYGINRISQQKIVLDLYREFKKGGSAYLQIER